jgi:hypothetical protein
MQYRGPSTSNDFAQHRRAIAAGHSGPDGYWEGRLRQETQAALDTSDARCAARHVELANLYALLLCDRQSGDADAKDPQLAAVERQS